MPRTAVATRTATAICWENFSILMINGGFDRVVSATATAIFPTSVQIPVLTIKPRQIPRTTVVPANAIFSWSLMGISSGRVVTFFVTGTDSPVRTDSSIEQSAT